MKVLLTGAAGFIGRAVRAEAQAAGHEVVGFDRAGDTAEDIVDARSGPRGERGM